MYFKAKPVCPVRTISAQFDMFGWESPKKLGKKVPAF